MKEHPILFSTPMTQAILNGRKTVTRRVLPIQPDNECYFEMKLVDGLLTIDYNQGDENPKVKCRYGVAGDILWVRETFYQAYRKTLESNGVIYKADYGYRSDLPKQYLPPQGWRPSIFMPREACRIRLEIKSIGVERLHEITEEDAIREGVKYLRKSECGHDAYQCYLDIAAGHWSAKASFQSLWIKINGAESWNANPWVWRIEFKKL